MDRLKSLFSGCIQARKRSKAQYHDSWLAPAPAPCTHHQPSTPQQPTQPKGLSKTSSIRIVESDPDDSSDGPSRRLRLSRCAPDEPADDTDEESLHPDDDGIDEPQALPQPQSWTNHALTTEVKRRIEDIPEEDEGDERVEVPATPAPAQHPRRRKSLVEIIQLLQATTTAIKGAAHGVPGRPLLRSPAAGAGSSTPSLPSLASSLSTHDTDSDDEVKRQRRVGAIVFPAAMRLRGWTEGRKKRPVSVAAGADEKGVFC